MSNLKYEEILESLIDVLMIEKTKEDKLKVVSKILIDNVPNVIWAGFYLINEDGDLILAPYVGEPACIKIELGAGVCGTSALLMETKKVYDVSKFPGHIVCDENAKSELVVPIVKNDVVYGVIDLDSDRLGNFTVEDQDFVERVRDILITSIDFK
ncbi:GAF domain-containing protein [Miniphocaeibacter massiliensis]|uniref:GAF domain-containing protein n=1 Tax=Miniphocaeibacter massiliensis TaxID=2041841 RepID=UPI000C1C746E|nr:GAF domain-containing protein [Miniphocaeibacter massiliensis]